MKWKEIIVGALSALFVTLLGGVGVYYWTKEPDTKKTEVLEYSVDQVASFKGGSNTNNLGVATVKVWNRGGVSAQQAKLTIDFATAQVSDFSYESTSAIKPKIQVLDKRVVEVLFENLVPDESVSVSVLTTTPETPKVTLRSSASIGKLSQSSRDVTTREKRLNQIVGYLVPAGAVMFLLATVTLLYSSRKRILIEHKSAKNNVGFLLLHQGQISAAEKILSKAVLSGEDAPFSLANASYCHWLAGRQHEAIAFLNAARFYSDSAREIAVVNFNAALIELAKGDVDEFFKVLLDAVKADRKAVISYCNYSVHVAAIRSDPRYKTVLGLQ